MSLEGIFAEIDRVVAVIGCQRSGTTVTAQVLGAATSALLIDEFDGLYAWFRQCRGAASALHQQVLAAAALKYKSSDRFDGDGACIRLKPCVTTLVLKAPNLTFDETELLAFPVPVSIVYPVRDPRAVVASMQRLSKIDFVGNQLRLISERPAIAEHYSAERDVMMDAAVPSWVQQAVLWRVKSGRAETFRKIGLPVESFRYEALTIDPDGVLEMLCRACHLPAISASAAASVYVGLAPGGTDRTRVVDIKSLDLFASALSASQQSEILQAAAPLSKEFGYALHGSHARR